MSLLLIIALAAAAHQAHPTGQASDQTPASDAIVHEITVIGRRLDGWRGQVAFERKKPRCRTVNSTGDRRIDRIGCDAMVHCVLSIRNHNPSGHSEASELPRLMSICVREQRDARIKSYLSSHRR